RGGLARLRERLLPEGHEILGLAELRAVLPQRLEGQVEQRHAGGLHGEDRAEAVLPSRWAKLTKKQPKVAQWFRLRVPEMPVKTGSCGYRSRRRIRAGAAAAGER